MRRFFLSFLICLITIACAGKNLSPIDYGLFNASSDLERYDVLLRVHKDAVEKGYGVSYKGIKQISIEIPKIGQSIPLTHITDFAGARIIVRNNVKNLPLFISTQELYKINISKEQLASGNFRVYPELKKGNTLLIVEDLSKWVGQRRGYFYGATRKDILFLKRGKAKNRTIASYSDSESNPIFSWCRVSGEIIIQNLIFERTADSEKITNLVFLANNNNILIKNVRIITPSNTGLNADCAIKLENCTNVKFEDVEIDGTYSLSKKYGYGIGMNNVWNSSFVRLKAKGEWGIFGNNNINCASLRDCEINRFDIHCYGRDVICRNTVFTDLYNQFSSFFGSLRFEGCKFIKFIPVLFESSYSAYSFFNLEFDNCYIEVAKDRPYLIHAGSPELLAEYPRYMFSIVNWPDIKIKDLKVVLPDGIKNWTIFHFSSGDSVSISGISDISIEHLIIESSDNSTFVNLTNNKVFFENSLNIHLSKSSISDIKRK